MEYLEGRHAILAALQSGQRRFHAILIREGAHIERFAEIIALAEARAIPIRRAPRAELEALAHGATHGGILAAVAPRQRRGATDLRELLARLREPALLLLLEGVDDARNLGFTLRTADALGAHALLIKKHVWDFDAGEVARPASGAYERLPLVQVEDAVELRSMMQQARIEIVGCIAGARRTLCEADLTRPTMLVIGGEKRGISGAMRAVCDLFVTIPTRAGASLSLSHAAAIALAEAARQRRPALPAAAPDAP